MENLVKTLFFENSTVDPSLKACKKKDDILVQRHYLNASIIDLHKKFLNENEQIKMKLSTFYKYRPKNCVPLKATERHVLVFYMIILICLHKLSSKIMSLKKIL